MIYVFDLGGILIDWSPLRLYKKLLPEKEAQEFLQDICTSSWNHQQDLGCDFSEANAKLITHFPQKKDLIEAYYGRWLEMCNGLYPENIQLRNTLKSQGHTVCALTNFARPTLDLAIRTWPELGQFDFMIVSADLKQAKPEPDIYLSLMNKSQGRPEEHIFFDDKKENIQTARNLGWQALHIPEGEAIEPILNKHLAHVC